MFSLEMQTMLKNFQVDLPEKITPKFFEVNEHIGAEYWLFWIAQTHNQELLSGVYEKTYNEINDIWRVVLKNAVKYGCTITPRIKEKAKELKIPNWENMQIWTGI